MSTKIREAVEIGWRAKVKRRTQPKKKSDARPKQDSMVVRQVARRTTMKRIARRLPMLDEAGLSKVFAAICIGGDKISYFDGHRDGHVATVEFRTVANADEPEVYIQIYNDGTYDSFVDRQWYADLQPIALSAERAVKFVTELKLKKSSR